MRLFFHFLLCFFLSLAPGVCQSIYIVNSTDDLEDVDLADLHCADKKGNCTLRAAIENANKYPNKDKVHFRILGKGPFEIILNKNLPKITEPIDLDATTQPSYIVGYPRIILNGRNIPKVANWFDEDKSPIGFHLTGHSSGSTIKGFVIGGFGYFKETASRKDPVYYPGSGILIKTEKNVIQSNYIGLSVDGNSSFGNSFGIGIHTSHNLIGGFNRAERNVISANWRSGILSYSNNQIIGNFIGTDLDGNKGLGKQTGITLVFHAENNTIEQNLISGNNVGINISGDRNYILNNRIGTNLGGTQRVPNQLGIFLDNARKNVIEEGNLISGNIIGIRLSSDYLKSGQENYIWGNFIGTGPAGQGTLPNEIGIHIYQSDGNIIGGNISKKRNIISGNTGPGIKFSEANGNIVTGNFIGSDGTGKIALPNFTGIEFFGEPGSESSRDNMIHDNLISGNIEDGVKLNYAEGNSIIGNYIGTAIDGITPLPNYGNGIKIAQKTLNNCIGGSLTNKFNNIAFNKENGIFINTIDSLKVIPQKNQILQNRIFNNKRPGMFLNKNQNLKADK